MIQKLADMVGVTPQVFIITIVLFAAAFAVLWIKMSFDEKKGVNSKEKDEIRKIITNLVPDGGQYTAAYAHSTEYQGRIRYYHYYAVGFRPDQTDHVWVVPIGVEGDRIVYTEPVRASAENLEYVGGNGHLLLLKFPGKRNNFFQLSVDASNTKLGKECRVNIQQPEEAEAFPPFAEAFQEKVNNALGVDKKGRMLRPK
ncbi:MAG: hypothetical protein K2O84_04925 [Oscillospiraceae bacterium]|jgi:hypothetical protein|nr:hypothetical protein [Oscillospiraceae bacterium]